MPDKKSSRIYDITLPIRTGGVVYPGNPEISIHRQQSLDRGDSSNVSALQFGSHTGTHVDAPLHMIADGDPVDALPLDVLMGPALVAEFEDDVRAIGREELRPIEEISLGGLERILLKTRNSRWLADPAQPFHRDYTYLAPDGAEYLVEHGVRLVGIDYLSVEQFHSGHHRTHHTLLTHDVIIVEGVVLDTVPPGRYELRCLPLRIAGCDGAPARAILTTGD